MFFYKNRSNILGNTYIKNFQISQRNNIYHSNNIYALISRHDKAFTY